MPVAGLPVDGVVEGSAERAVAAKGRTHVVEREKGDGGLCVVPDLLAEQPGQLGTPPAGDLVQDVQGPGQVLLQGLGHRGDHPVDDPVKSGDPAVMVGGGGQHDLTSPIPPSELEGPRAHRGPEGALAGVRVDLAWKDAGGLQGQQGEEGTVGILQLDGDRARIQRPQSGEPDGSPLLEGAAPPHL
jgi:hypothetical protein